MRFYTTTTTIAVGLIGLMNSGVKALTITSPSPSSYWVQFDSNTIAWGVDSTDPSTVSLQIINPGDKNFRGPFAIAEYVKASLMSYQVTNVTLSLADGYQVQMVDPANTTRVLATSAPFSVRAMGTTPAQVTYAPGTVNSTSNQNGTSHSGNSTGYSTHNSSGIKNFNGSANDNAKSSATGHLQLLNPSTCLAICSLSSLMFSLSF